MIKPIAEHTLWKSTNANTDCRANQCFDLDGGRSGSRCDCLMSQESFVIFQLGSSSDHQECGAETAWRWGDDRFINLISQFLLNNCPANVAGVVSTTRYPVKTRLT